MMQQNLDNLRSRMRELKQTSGGLVTQLTAGARELEEWSLSRSLRLAQMVEQFQHRFSDLAESLHDAAAADNAPLPVASGLVGIVELEENLAHVGAVRQKIRHAEYLRGRAISLLEEIEQIDCPDEPTFPPLQECLQQARDLKSSVEAASGVTVPEVVDDLLHDHHPLCALRKLVLVGDELDDAEWSRLHETISADFGRILATAVARGRLKITRDPSLSREDGAVSRSSNDAIATPSATTPSPQAVTPPAPSVNETPAPPIPETVESAIAEEETSEELTDGPLTVPNLHVPIELPGTAKRRRPGFGRRSPQSLAQISREALKAAGASRTELLQKVIWRLILEDRMEIAAHLAACLESHNGGEGLAPPASLIRCLALCPEVRTPEGEVARALTADLDRVAWLKAGDSGDLHSLSLRILKAAAAFRPALLAPGTGAATVLREQPLEQTLSNFYNYGHRIATFSDRGVPLDPGQFKRLRSEAEWQQELDSVQAEVESWLNHPPAGAIQYQTATHCFLRSHWSISPGRATRFPEAMRFWQEWQEPLNRLHRLLEIVRDNAADQLATVRTDTAILSDFLRDAARNDAAALSESADLPAGAIRVDQAHTWFRKSLEAIDRWRALQESPPQRRELPIPRNADDLENEQRAMHLREEILRRQDSVLRELKALGEEHRSESLAAAVACCCRTIQDIRHLLDADGEWSTVESNPHEELIGELRMIPGIPIDDEGRPALEPGVLEERLLTSLANAEPDPQGELDNNPSEIPVALPVGPAPAHRHATDSNEAPTSTTDAEAEADTERRAVRDGIHEVRQLAAEIFASGAMQASDWEQIDMRLMQLERQLPTATSFDSLYRELGECRELADDNLRRETGKIRSRMTQLNLDDQQSTRSQIEAALKKHDLRTATRLMEAVAGGEQS